LDEASFEKLFKSHFKGLARFAQKYVKDFETAKEITQDAFINLWEKRNSIDLSKPVKSYLTTTIYNKSLNYLRDNKKFNKDILNFENLYSLSDHEQGDKLVAAEIDKKIKSAIELLPEKCREIFVMNRFQNLKYQQVADKLGISIKTVETQMSKALQHMREHLVDYITILLIVFETFSNNFK
jgi:RNA polymerase sigma-70 factor (ECF subfamily)